MQMSLSFTVRAAVLAASILLPVFVSAAPPVAGPNVNMVTGTKWPEGDPFLTKQNEESHAVSSRNPRHLLGASNDYRLVPVEVAEALDEPEAWINLYKSVDGGETWRSTLMGGCPVNIPQCNDSTGLTAPLKALTPNFGADPTVRPGPYGTFFVSFIAGKRDNSAGGVVATQRFVDKNNDIQRNTDLRTCTAGTAGCRTVDVYTPQGCTPNTSGCTRTVANVLLKPAEDPIVPDAFAIVDTGTPGQFKDKPWNAADVSGRPWNAGKTCELLSWTKNRADVTNVAETVPAFNVYVSFANFVGQSSSNQHPQARVAVSNDCGKTFGKAIKLSSGVNANSGTNIAIDPQTGAVYVVWRAFAPDAIYLNKSTDGGVTWLLNPIRVANIIPYDQGATSVSFRTLGFPTIAVSVKGTQSRVHVAWSQRKANVGTTPPYACQSTNPADCDARVAMATSLDGGNTWPAPVYVDNNFTVQYETTVGGQPVQRTHQRGHQVQPAMAFAAGKLLITWLDQRLDHTEGVLGCPAGNTCTSINDYVEFREGKGNLDASCTNAVLPAPYGPACNKPEAVFSTYISDGTPGLVRRHTLDTYAAMSDPDVLNFASTRVSQYAFGSTVAGTIDPGTGKLTPTPGLFNIRQKEVNPPNLPMFANGKVGFHGDYIDVAGQIIVATTDPVRPYKFNVGDGANGNFTTSGPAPVFHVSFTDNRDVIPPIDGNWVTPTCLATGLVKDVNGNVTGTTNFTGCNSPGYAGNRNQNVYSAIVAENSVAFANSNSKLLNTTGPRGFVVTVQNLSDTPRNYTLTLPAQASGVAVSFNKDIFPAGNALPAPLSVTVQPHSSSTRTVWAKVANANQAKTKVVVQIASLDNTFTTQLSLNPDPNAAFVTNGDGTSNDVANDDLGNVVLSNAVLTNNALTNNPPSNPLTDNVLTNNALTNAVLSNVVLSNAVLSNLQVENLNPSNAAAPNNVLTNNALSNVVLTNAVLSNNALSNAVLSNVVLTNNTLNVALTNLDPANVALSNAVLSNNALTNVVLSNLDPNNALTNAMLSNAVLSNAVLSNVALSNAALSNNVLTNNALSNAVLSNAPLIDTSSGETTKTAASLKSIEQASFDVSGNQFLTVDLASSNFRETSFTVRNRGNTDTTLAIKLLLRDAVCTGAPSFTCTPPDGYKLQLVLRKVAFTPTAIPPTQPARLTNTSADRAYRIGLTQRNSEVSNVGTLPLIDPSDPNLGKFLPDDPNAATLPLAPGEWAYATIRAIGKAGASIPDPSDLLRWGTKSVGANATNAGNSLVITTLGFPANSVTALQNPNLLVRTSGGSGLVSGTAICTDKDGTPIPNAGSATADPQISTVSPPAGYVAKALVPCARAPIAVSDDGTSTRTAKLSFTPQYWGEFYTLASLQDGSATPQKDRQVIKVVVNPATPVVTVDTSRFPWSATPRPLTFGDTLDLYTLVTGPTRVVSSTSPVPFNQFTAGGSCYLDPDGHTLRISQASLPGQPDCNVTFHQDGNETYAPITAPSPVIPILIAPADTTTVLASSAQPSVYGQPVSLTSTVTPAFLTSTAATGTLTFYEAGNPISSAPLVVASGVGAVTATFNSGFPVGIHTFTSTYSGDRNYKTSGTGPFSQTVNKASTATVVGSSASPSVYGQGVTFTATVSVRSPGAGNPTGTIAFVDGTTTIASCSLQLLASGQATCATSALAVGTHSITATYSGDGNFFASSGSVTQTVNKAPTATAVTSSTNPSVYGQGVTFTGTVSVQSPGAGVPTGTIAFKDGTATIASCAAQAISGNQATCATGALSVANHSVTATYSGDGNFLGSTSSALSQEVDKATTATTVTSSATPTVFGQSITFTATVSVQSPGAGVPTGTIAFMDGAIAIASCAAQAISSNQASCATSTLAAGNHSITATYSGDGNFLGSTSPALSQTVNKAATTNVATSSVNPSAYGQSVTITATLSVQAPGVGTPTGTVEFKDGATSLGTGTVLGNAASITLTTLAIGSHPITATYSGDGNFLGSDGNITQVVNSAAITTTVTSSLNPSAFGQVVTFTATIAGTTPTGSVHFKAGGETIVGCVAAVVNAGQAQCVINTLDVGTHAITGDYSGDANNAASTSAALTQTVTTALGDTTPMLAAGNTHTCALDGSGGVQCWGRNNTGELGDTSSIDRWAPVPASGLGTGVDAISTGAEHSCALTATGGVKCWGSNAFGQLGDGTTSDQHSPVDVFGLTSGVLAIAAGFDHTCALTSAGGVKCWGHNQNGQLGDGTTSDQHSPIAVQGLSGGVVAIASAQFHTCALTISGGVKCWGGNGFGQLGDNSTTDRLTATDVVGLGTGVSAIAIAGGYSCALTDAGGVKCWGLNGVGQLGDSTSVNRLTPVDTAGLGSGVSAIAAGGAHACALTINGGMKCWGYNGTGQLGDGTQTNSLVPIDVNGMTSGVSAIAAGGDHTCALVSSGQVTCWGNNSFGQLGDGTNSNRPTATPYVNDLNLTQAPTPDLLLNADTDTGTYSLFTTSGSPATITTSGHSGNGFLLPPFADDNLGNPNRPNGPYVVGGDLAARIGLTVAAWIRPDDLTKEQTIVSKYDSQVAGVSWYVVVGGIPGGGTLGLRAGVFGDLNTARGFTAPYPVAAAVWTHVAFVYSAATQQGTFYVNGLAQQTTPSGDSLPAIRLNATPVRLGTLFAGGNYIGPTAYFAGIIDEVKCYAAALMPGQILRLAE